MNDLCFCIYCYGFLEKCQVSQTFTKLYASSPLQNKKDEETLIHPFNSFSLPT